MKENMLTIQPGSSPAAERNTEQSISPVAPANRDHIPLENPEPHPQLSFLEKIGVADINWHEPKFFVTAEGRKIITDLDVLLAIREVKTAGALHDEFDIAAQKVAALPGFGLMMIGGTTSMPTTLVNLHAAIDIAKKYGFLLFVQTSPNTRRVVRCITARLRQDAGLNSLLGAVRIESREGQKIAWDYIRQSSTRGAVQQYLPEALASLELDNPATKTLYLFESDGEQAETTKQTIMVASMTYKLLPDQKGIYVGNIHDAAFMHIAMSDYGMNIQSRAIFDGTANYPQAIFDTSEDTTHCTSRMAGIYSDFFARHDHKNPRSESVPLRVAANMHPFS